MESSLLRKPNQGRQKKSSVFKKEYDHIKNENFKQYIIEMLELLPDYFYRVPASSTGQYHPKYALGHEGLVRHTKAMVGILVELLKNETLFGDLSEYKDIAVGSALLHDGLKHGKDESEYTIAEHPIEIVDFLIAHYRGQISQEEFSKLCSCIKSHMGQWNTHPYTKVEILPKPKEDLEKLVHLADFLASRKCLEFNFSA